MEIFPSFTWAEGIAVVVICFIAGIMRGYAGFGSALTMMPVVAYAFGPQLAVPAVMAVHLVTSAQLVPSALRDVEWGRVGPLSIAGSIAIPVGAWVLATQDPELLRQAISILIIFFAVLMMRGWRYTGNVNGWVMAAAGAIGGLITGATTLGGPPVVTFLMAGPFTAAQNRAAIILYFIFVQAVAVIVYWFAALWVWPILGICLLIAPSLMLGMWMGQYLFAKSSEGGFRRVALSFLIAIGVTTLFL